MGHYGDGNRGGATGSEGRVGGIATSGGRRGKVEETRMRIGETDGTATKDRAPNGGDSGGNGEHEQE